MNSFNDKIAACRNVNFKGAKPQRCPYLSGHKCWFQVVVEAAERIIDISKVSHCPLWTGKFPFKDLPRCKFIFAEFGMVPESYEQRTVGELRRTREERVRFVSPGHYVQRGDTSYAATQA